MFVSAVDPDPSSKADPCSYFVRYSPGVLNRTTKVLDTFNGDTKCFLKIDIWARIRTK